MFDIEETKEFEDALRRVNQEIHVQRLIEDGWYDELLIHEEKDEIICQLKSLGIYDFDTIKNLENGKYMYRSKIYSKK